MPPLPNTYALMNETPDGTVNVLPELVINEVLPKLLAGFAHCGEALEPYEVSTWPAVPVEPPTLTAPEALTSNVLLRTARFDVLPIRHPTQVIIK